jgi:hypothetical protein
MSPDPTVSATTLAASRLDLVDLDQTRSLLRSPTGVLIQHIGFFGDWRYEK